MDFVKEKYKLYLNKIVMSWGSRKEKRAFFVPFILSEGNVFNICVLSQCIVY